MPVKILQGDLFYRNTLVKFFFSVNGFFHTHIDMFKYRFLFHDVIHNELLLLLTLNVYNYCGVETLGDYFSLLHSKIQISEM